MLMTIQGATFKQCWLLCSAVGFTWIYVYRILAFNVPPDSAHTCYGQELKKTYDILLAIARNIIYCHIKKLIELIDLFAIKGCWKQLHLQLNYMPESNFLCAMIANACHSLWYVLMREVNDKKNVAIAIDTLWLSWHGSHTTMHKSNCNFWIWLR